MFRAKIFDPLRGDNFYPDNPEELVRDRYSAEEYKGYYEKYGFYPYEIWNVDFTFLCFMYSHLRALNEFQTKYEEHTEFHDKISALAEKVSGIMISGYDFMNPEDLSKYKEVCKEFIELIPGMWT